MAWAVNGTPNTLTSGGNTMTISDLSIIMEEDLLEGNADN